MAEKESHAPISGNVNRNTGRNDLRKAGPRIFQYRTDIDR